MPRCRCLPFGKSFSPFYICPLLANNPDRVTLPNRDILFHDRHTRDRNANSPPPALTMRHDCSLHSYDINHHRYRSDVHPRTHRSTNSSRSLSLPWSDTPAPCALVSFQHCRRNAPSRGCSMNTFYLPSPPTQLRPATSLTLREPCLTPPLPLLLPPPPLYMYFLPPTAQPPLAAPSEPRYSLQPLLAWSSLPILKPPALAFRNSWQGVTFHSSRIPHLWSSAICGKV
jgi:hypothetical protein